jgi:hypothetical protein
MTWLSKAARAVGKGVKGVAKVASKAAPLVGLIPGVGAIPAGLLGAGGALLSGENVRTALARGAAGATGGLAGAALRGGGSGGTSGGTFQNILSTLTQAAPLVAGAAGTVSAAQQGNAANRAIGRQSEYAGDLATLGRNIAASAAPVRDASSAALLARINQGSRGRPDLSGFADTRNPFRSKYPVASAAPPTVPGTGNVPLPTAPAALPPAPMAALDEVAARTQQAQSRATTDISPAAIEERRRKLALVGGGALPPSLLSRRFAAGAA